MLIRPSSAQRESRQSSFPAARRRSFPAALVHLATAIAVIGVLTQPQAARAGTRLKVVVVVGPVGSATYDYISDARRIAYQARSYGARVHEIYSPNATWSKVKYYARGANLLVYLGHGNGWPSPYAPFQRMTKDGMGLNARAGSGHYNKKYYGEYFLANYLHLAPNAVVLLHRLCYASGNSEPGRAAPTRYTAHRRVDNYGAGFLRTGGRAVFAEGWKSTRYILYGLFRTKRSISQIFWSSSHAKRTYASSFRSTRTPGTRAILDPYYYRGYYRSVIGDLGMTAVTWRGG